MYVCMYSGLATCRLEYGNGVFYPELDYDSESLMPRSHQSLNIFKSCLVKHGLKLLFFMKAAC